ncbi:zf-BED domain-containing protein [Tanacetum coccineum]
METLTLKGPPCGMRHPYHNDIRITPWTEQLALEFRYLKELHIRHLVVPDEDLETLARTRGRDLRSLKISKCIGFSTDGLRHVSKYCNQLRTLCLGYSYDIEVNDGIWLHELALNSTVLEMFKFKHTEISNAEDLTLLAKNCCNSLISLKIGRCYLSKLGDAFRYAVRLEHFGGDIWDEENDLVGDQLSSVRLRDISYQALECLGTHLKNLRKSCMNLDKIDGTTHLPLDIGIRALLMGCNKLERKSNAGLVKLSEGCPRLRKLKLWGYIMRKSSSGSAPAPSSSAPSASSKRMRGNAAGARTDVAWEYGLDLGLRRVKCKFCQEEFTGGMFRFKHHLARTHQNVGACTRVPEDVKVKMQNILEQNELNSKKRKGIFMIEEVEQPSKRGKVQQNTLNKIFKKDEREKVCQQIARRGLDPPSYHEIRVTFLKKEVDYTKSLLEEYKNEWKKTGCTLMTDGWSDRKNRPICNFLVNNPKGTIFLASIDTSDISKTKEKVFAMLDDFVKKISEEHVVQVVTDNAANYKAAGEMLMNKRNKLFWTPCAAHCIDLMLEDFEKKIKEHKVTIVKGRRVVSFIYNRTRLICLLKEFSNGKELLKPGATRFATSYLTLCRLYELKGAWISMFASEKWENSNFAKSQAGKNIESIVLDNVGFWRSVNTCCTAAIPLIRVLRMVDSDSPDMGFILDAMVNAKKEIKSMYKDVQSMYQPVLDIIDEKWENQLQRPLHVAGKWMEKGLKDRSTQNEQLQGRMV